MGQTLSDFRSVSYFGVCISKLLYYALQTKLCLLGRHFKSDGPNRSSRCRPSPI